MTRQELIDLLSGGFASDDIVESAADMLRADGEEIERLRMQLAACGVIANANTVESAAHCRDMHPDYWCDSVAAVADTVDREMALRARVAELEAAQRMRPMSDAPRDGTRILVLFVRSEIFTTPGFFLVRWDKDDGSWQTGEYDMIAEDNLQGWWPLPSAPEDGK